MTTPHCPICKRKLDDATSLGQRPKPRAGDFSVCGYCGGLLCFCDDARSLRIASDAELREFERRQPDQYQTMIFASLFCTMTPDREKRG